MPNSKTHDGYANRCLAVPALLHAPFDHSVVREMRISTQFDRRSSVNYVQAAISHLVRAKSLLIDVP
jgi:hypothetical protein